MSYGWHNPWPFQWGGGETEDEIVYEAMRRAVGRRGSASDDSGIDGLWRQVRAEAIATLNTFAERAVLQVFPGVATDHIPLYEEYLGIAPSATATQEDRRQEILARVTFDLLADEPDVRQQLQRIDSRIDTVQLPHAKTDIVMLGKAFEPQNATPDYGPTVSTGYPNYSTEFWVPVLFDLAGAAPSASQSLVVGRIKRLLNTLLPSWVSFAVMTSSPGFFLDVSALDFTAIT
jgi:hypothetical protein